MLKHTKLLSLFICGVLVSCSSNTSTNTNSETSLRAQAEAIYDKMSLDEKIGQLVLPNYGLLAQGPGASVTACTNDLNNASTSESQIIADCGLNQIAQYHLGAILQGGGPIFPGVAPTAANFAKINNIAQKVHTQSVPYDNILLIGNDMVHMNSHIQGGVIGPHNIGLGAANDSQLVQQLEEVAAQDSLATGFNWAYAPTVAKVHDLRWGRTYEGFSDNPQILENLAHAAVTGLQIMKNGQITGVLATAKHFVGDGATLYGLDEGDDAFTGSQEQFWQQNGLGYEASVSANVGSLMASYSAIDGNDTRMHFGGKWDIINQFKNNGIIGTNNKTFQFGGFVVSDWEAATRAAYFQQMVTGESLTLPQIYAKSINAGVDMQMVATGDTLNPRAPQSESNTLWYSTVGEVVDAFKSAYNNGLISESTLHNSVIRILMTKLSMQPQSITMNDYPNIQAKERELALKASEQSLVLLKNESSIIPINPGTITNVVFVGKTNDVGIQNGGWTINWQGQEGNQYFTGTDGISSGTVTIESAIIKKLGTSVNYYYVNDSESVNNLPITGVGGANTLVIGVVNEPPYAEYMGDIANNVESDEWYSWGIKTNTNRYMPAIQKDNLNVTYSTIHEATTIESLYNSGAKIITIIYSGRPVILQGIAGSPDAISNAEIAAFLPGTTGGQAISNAIFGNYHFRANGKSNTLPFPWPLNMQQVEDHFKNGSLYPSGYGLSS